MARNPEALITYKGQTLIYTYWVELADFLAEVDGLDPIEDEAYIESLTQRIDSTAVPA